MKRVLITGMSGAGKSALIEVLRSRGYTGVDLDEGGYSHEVDAPSHEVTGLGGGRDWVWREYRFHELLSSFEGDPQCRCHSSARGGRRRNSATHRANGTSAGIVLAAWRVWSQLERVSIKSRDASSLTELHFSERDVDVPEITRAI